MNIAVLSGSFNPIHVGHLILGNYLTEFVGLEEVWYLVTPHNPLKEKTGLLDENLRLEMTQLALVDYPKLTASDFEFSMPRPSYTIDTLRALRKQYPEHQFSLLIGSDNWAIFDKWKSYKELLEEFEVYVYPRLGYEIVISSNLAKRVQKIEAPVMDISSTFIRESLAAGKQMSAFIPKEVELLIKEKGLYI